MSLASSTANVRHQVSNSVGRGAKRIRRPAFYLVTLALVAFMIVALRESMAMVASGWLGGYAFPGHRVHHVMIGGTLTVFGLAVAVQLYRPERRVGAMQAAIAFMIAALVLSAIASGVGAAAELLIFAVPVAIIAILHPAVRELVPSREGMDARMMALAVIGAIGAGILAIGEYTAHTTLGNEHAVFGHYEFMLIALTSIGLFALLGALRPVGWRALVYAAAALAVLFALVSVAFPGAEQGSSLGAILALSVIVWAIAYVGLAEYVERGGTALRWRRNAESA